MSTLEPKKARPFKISSNGAQFASINQFCLTQAKWKKNLRIFPVSRLKTTSRSTRTASAPAATIEFQSIQFIPNWQHPKRPRLSHRHRANELILDFEVNLPEIAVIRKLRHDDDSMKLLAKSSKNCNINVLKSFAVQHRTDLFVIFDMTLAVLGSPSFCSKDHRWTWRCRRD